MVERKIWKFPLSGGEGNTFHATLPSGAQILSAGFEPGGPGRFVVWAIVDPDAPAFMRFFHIAGTGHVLDKGVRRADLIERIALAQPGGPPLIFHVFDLTPVPEIPDCETGGSYHG